MLDAIRHGLTGLFRFSGRDGRRRFWLYVAFVYLVTQAISILVVMPVMNQLFVAAVQSGADRSADPERAFRETMELFGTAFSSIEWITIAITAISVAMLAAAVARRLHDRDRSGYWGLLPVPFLVLAIVLTRRFLAAFQDARTGQDGSLETMPDMGVLLLLVVNNLIYLGLLITLIVILAGAGTPGPNRFGPPPD